MISLLVVNYRSAVLAADAIRTARAASSSPLQVVVVDNSEDPAEAHALRGIADVLIVSSTNRGYAGGINDGRRACDGDTIVVTNPDVRFAPQSIDHLVAALDAKTAVAGPALFWDDAHEWRLPPGDLGTGWQKLDELLASRSRAWADVRDARRSRARIAFWSLADTTHVAMLSGAVLAIRASDFDAVGGFDERFRLYFEEADFLRRVAAHRKRIAYVPAARCRHLYNQSAGQERETAAARYAESQRKYLEKWNGPFAARALERFARPLPAHDAQPLDGALRLDRDGVVVEVSPLASFATAAGFFADSRHVVLPPDVRAALRDDELYLRVVARDTARVLATYKITA
ncbi:MAG: glycosyltransferase family 2 protein [Acidobacteria bacterium]|nr:glycosyltransferase family 2 protein [Acidobacteriota bacterium]MBV9476426.1 glycosyltransferase family 2 protein [Acidobacteriota bacterium]